MTQIILTAAATAATSTLNLPPLAKTAITIGSKIGGQLLDKALKSKSKHLGPQLDYLEVQTATYGRMIPIVYGKARIAGNIIWSQPIKEEIQKTGGGKGGSGSGGVTNGGMASRTATFAVAVCKHTTVEISRIWSDTKLLDLSQIKYRFYDGNNQQLPDPLIESIEGVGKTPAYRGLSYIVFENLSLDNFGGRIPNLTFEVVMKQAANAKTLEHRITDLVMIPGSGEFVYDTMLQTKQRADRINDQWIGRGPRTYINQHSHLPKADARVSLDQLKHTCPNVKWIAPVVTWFGTHTDAKHCTITPGVEFRGHAVTTPESWHVAGHTRDAAHLISTDSNQRPSYGGTIHDNAYLRYLDELASRNYHIVCYPMFFLDTPTKPWRGRVTGTPEDIKNFFTKPKGYNAFILHYAQLVKGRVAAFVIGSELIGLTRVRDEQGNYPAVTELINLAQQVRNILGPNVKLTYAADWSEYHHTEGGWFNLDPLWADPNIDMIGIDAYFPLSHEPHSLYDEHTIQQGWTHGEGYDYIYTDKNKTIKQPVSPQYAWKNLSYFWEQFHTNPDGRTTAWQPKSKPIWFTELGFPSVDACTNQPNVFHDPRSSESAFPFLSMGRPDFKAQRAALSASLRQWEHSPMIEHTFLWTWDARPFPYWPDMKHIWADHDLWKTGHWLNGKLGISSLANTLQDLCKQAGISEQHIDVSQITDTLDGYVLTHPISAHRAIEALLTAYFLTATEKNGKIHFIPKDKTIAQPIDPMHITLNQDKHTQNQQLTRIPDSELPYRVNVNFINLAQHYEPGNQHASRPSKSSHEHHNLHLPIVMTDNQAKHIAEVTLYNSWQQRNQLTLTLPYDLYHHLSPGDTISFTQNNTHYTLRITHTRLKDQTQLELSTHSEDLTLYHSSHNTPTISTTPLISQPPAANTILHILDLPTMPKTGHSQPTLLIAATSLDDHWPGCTLYQSVDNEQSYHPIRTIPKAHRATTGHTTTAIDDHPITTLDRHNDIIVNLIHGELESVTEQALMNGQNLCLIGNELIQFQHATLIAPHQYRLHTLIRGKYGTNHETKNHSPGERFIVLNHAIESYHYSPHMVDIALHYKAVTHNTPIESTASQYFTATANNQKPYQPVNIQHDGQTLSWTPRSNTNGEWKNHHETPPEATFLVNGKTIKTPQTKTPTKTTPVAL